MCSFFPHFHRPNGFFNSIKWYSTTVNLLLTAFQMSISLLYNSSWSRANSSLRSAWSTSVSLSFSSTAHAFWSTNFQQRAIRSFRNNFKLLINYGKWLNLLPSIRRMKLCSKCIVHCQHLISDNPRMLRPDQQYHTFLLKQKIFYLSIKIN